MSAPPQTPPIPRNQPNIHPALVGSAISEALASPRHVVVPPVFPLSPRPSMGLPAVPPSVATPRGGGGGARLPPRGPLVEPSPRAATLAIPSLQLPSSGGRHHLPPLSGPGWGGTLLQLPLSSPRHHTGAAAESPRVPPTPDSRGNHFSAAWASSGRPFSFYPQHDPLQTPGGHAGGGHQPLQLNSSAAKSLMEHSLRTMAMSPAAAGGFKDASPFGLTMSAPRLGGSATGLQRLAAPSTPRAGGAGGGTGSTPSGGSMTSVGTGPGPAIDDVQGSRPGKDHPPYPSPRGSAAAATSRRIWHPTTFMSPIVAPAQLPPQPGHIQSAVGRQQPLHISAAVMGSAATALAPSVSGTPLSLPPAAPPPGTPRAARNYEGFQRALVLNTNDQKSVPAQELDRLDPGDAVPPQVYQRLLQIRRDEPWMGWIRDEAPTGSGASQRPQLRT